MRTTFHILLIGLLVVLGTRSVYALSSETYTVPQFQLDNGGLVGSSTNYGVRGITNPIAGVANSGSYSLDAGFPSETGNSITLSVNSATVDLGALTPGTPVNATTTTTVATDSLAGHSIAIQKSALLTHVLSSTTTISDFSGTIDTPVTFSGTGFGITITAGTTVDAKWSSGTKYAAIPTQTWATIHQVNQLITSPNTTTFRYQVDVLPSQQAGVYQMIVAYVATALP